VPVGGRDRKRKGRVLWQPPCYMLLNVGVRCLLCGVCVVWCVGGVVCGWCALWGVHMCPCCGSLVRLGRGPVV
jgi:hypothetical protein